MNTNQTSLAETANEGSVLPQIQKKFSEHRSWPADAEDLIAPDITARELPKNDKRSRFGAAVAGVPKHISKPAFISLSTRLTEALRGRALRPAWRWGLFGFVCGIVFWHFIGFWGFVSDVLLPSMPAKRADEASSPIARIHQSALNLPSRTAKPRLGKNSTGAAATNIESWTATVDQAAD